MYRYPAPSDLNKATAPGFYVYLQDAENSAKTIYNGNGNMMVINSSGSFIHQIVFIYNNAILMRRYSASWTPWKILVQ